jgi:uncharacterized Tic20 family protein
MTEPKVFTGRQLSKEEQNWGMLCHLTGLALLLGVPFGHILGPLIVWLIRRNHYPFVDEQGKESLNFQISMTIYAILSALLMLVAVGFVLIAVIVIADVVLAIVASVKVSNGKPYRYPLTIRFLK